MSSDLLRLLRDAQRLRVLSQTGLLDSPPEPRFDQYTKLAAKLLRAPASLISLVDADRQFFKSAFGLAEPWATLRETPLTHSFCKHAVTSGAALIVADAPNHPVVHDNLAIRDLGVVAYAGVPLEVAGQHVGVLCVIDGKRREWSSEELEALQGLADAVAAQMALISLKRDLQGQKDLLASLTDSALDAIITADSAGHVLFCNRATERMFQRSRSELVGAEITLLMPERYRAAHLQGLSRLRSGETPRLLERVVELHGLRADGTEFPIELSLSRVTADIGPLFTAVMRDTTERTLTIQALREAEEQLRLTVDQAPIGIALVALDGRWLRVNDALASIVGYSREELLQIDFQRITHPDDLDADLALVDQLLKGDIHRYELEKRYIRRDKQIVWILLSASLVRSERGEPRFFIAQVQDITARRAAETEARMFFDHSVDMLTITGLNGKLDKVNDAWQRTLGWSREELSKRPYIEFVHPEDRERTLAEANNLAQGRPTLDFRNRYAAKDGRYHWLDWRVHPTPEGALYCVTRDVTDQVERERELRLWKLALASASNGVLITTPTAMGNPITYVNPAFERMTGYAAAELIGQSCRLLQGTDRDQAEIELMRTAIRDQRECSVVVRNYRKDGQLFLNALTIAPVRNEHGIVTHYIGIAEDITARVQAEKLARQQKAVMEAVIASMGDSVIVTDETGRIILLSEVAKRLFGPFLANGVPLRWEPGRGLFLRDRMTRCEPEDYPPTRALRGETVDQFELWMHMPDWPEGRWHSVTGNPVRGPDGQLLGAVNVGRDITPRKALEERIRQAALTDELTGLYNRRGFILMGEQQVRLAIRQRRPLHLLFIDLDGMKQINDEFGHEVGDEALIETSTLLMRACRGSDVVARLGGDEFVVLAPGDSIAGTELRARLLSAVAEHNEQPQRRFFLSLSIGLASFDSMHPVSLTQMLLEADKAMYDIKRRSKSQPAVAAASPVPRPTDS